MAARMGSLQSSVAMYKAQSNTDPIKLPGNTHPPHRFHGLPGTTQFLYFHHVSFCTGSMEIRTWKLRRQKAHFGNDVQCPSSLTEGPANPQGHLAVGQQSCSILGSLSSCLTQPSAPEGSTHTTLLLPPPAEPPQQTTSNLRTLPLSLGSPASCCTRSDQSLKHNTEIPRKAFGFHS